MLIFVNSLSQMLRQNGGCHVVVAAPQGLKMDLAKKLGAGDVRAPPSPNSSASMHNLTTCCSVKRSS